MPIINDNFNKMNEPENLDESLDKASTVRFRINCEFLHSCAFHCPGCFVFRRNGYDDKQLDILATTIQTLRENEMTFDEIILGPTDFFAAVNTKELIAEPKFKALFADGDVVLTFPTTLQMPEEEILETIRVVNENLTHPNQEIEILIVPELEKIMANDLEYAAEFKKRIQLLDSFNSTVDYAIQMNIMNVDKLEGKFILSDVTKFVREQFNTIVEFNPSFLRTGKDKLIKPILNSWNNMLRDQINIDSRDDITFTMANTYHAGFNEITYNFHDGDLYMCPFIYENVFDKGDAFRVPKSDGDFYTWDDIIKHDASVKAAQFMYMSKTTECATCQHQMSCISKHVLYYMEQHEYVDCVIAKELIELYK